jgi:hypothetical protein
VSRNRHYAAAALSRRALLGAAALAVTAVPLRMQSASARQAELAWTQLAIDGAGPTARWDHTLAVDEGRRRLIVFGGRDGEATPLGDTWEFDLAEEVWSPIEGAGPSPRFGQAVAVDQDGGALYLFGGQDNAPTFYDDAWRLDLATGEWSEIETGGPRPAARYGTSAVLDGAGNLLVSHGFTFEGRFDDTWSLDPTTGVWTDVSPAAETRPLKRCLHEAVWDTDGARMLLYGGCSSGFGPCPQGDLWAFDPVAGAWTEMIPAAGPAARTNPALVVDPANGRALLLAGLTDAGYVADLWSLDLDDPASPAWRELTAAGAGPAPRASHDATISGDRLYLFGGNGDAGATADLWRLDLTSG